MTVRRRAILVYRGEDDEALEEEFKALAEAAGYEVVAYVRQRRVHPDPRYNIGRGKVQEIKKLVEELKPDKVIVYNELKPVQTYNLIKELGVEVIDRVELVLEIFAQRAGSREAKLQIELARLKHELPMIKERIRLSKLKELPGFLGGGAYALDTYYKHMLRRLHKIEREIKEIKKRKSLIRSGRKRRSPYPVIAIAGYTCAGKTTLFNALANEKKLVDDKPFATLDTCTRLVKLGPVKAYVVDTIGFIRNLPPILIDAFHTTLEDITLSDLVLLVVDASKPVNRVVEELETSLEILADIDAVSKPIVVALNKIDLLTPDEVKKRVEVVETGFSGEVREVVPISAAKRIGFSELENAIIRNLPNIARVRLVVPKHVLRRLEGVCSIVSVHGEGDEVVVEAYVPRTNFKSLTSWGVRLLEDNSSETGSQT